MNQIYLDYNATTPIAEEVSDAIIPFLREHYGNPSSAHLLGRKCREAIDEARQQVADLIGATAEEIYFTSGGTESNNLTIKGLFLKEAAKPGHLVTSSFEHPAIKEPALFEQSRGSQVTWLPVSSEGIIDMDKAAKAIDESTRLVTVMHANNEIGTLQPIKELSEICLQYQVPLHTDAAQSLGKVNVNVGELGVDFLSIAGHKLYAPKGVGALFVRKGHSLSRVIHGAGHEKGVRPGTENVPYIVGLGVAAELARKQLATAAPHLESLRDRMEAMLQSRIPGLTVNGKAVSRLPNTSSVNFPGVNATQMLGTIPDLLVSTGAACHSDTVALSDTLQAIGLDSETGKGTVRISCGKPTREEEIDQAVELLVKAWEKVSKGECE